MDAVKGTAQHNIKKSIHSTNFIVIKQMIRLVTSNFQAWGQFQKDLINSIIGVGIERF